VRWSLFHEILNFALGFSPLSKEILFILIVHVDWRLEVNIRVALLLRLALSEMVDFRTSCNRWPESSTNN
jgi:hypothetical protein